MKKGERKPPAPSLIGHPEERLGAWLPVRAGAGQTCMARKGWTLGWARSGQSGTAVQGALEIRRTQTRWVAGRQDLGGGFSVRGSLWGRRQGPLRSEVRAGVHG